MIATAPHARAFSQPTLGPAMGSHVVSSAGKRISRESLERLERLDDTVFAALKGDPEALDEAALAWREAQAQIDAQVLNETREHYVRRARSRFRRAQRDDAERLTVGFAALEILGLLDDRAA